MTGGEREQAPAVAARAQEERAQEEQAPAVFAHAQPASAGGSVPGQKDEE